MPIRLAHRSLATQYLIAISAWLIALSLGKALISPLGDGFPFATLIVAVMVSGWYGGFGPALLTSLAGAVSLIHVILDPVGLLGVKGIESQAGILLYLVVTIGMSIVCGAMRRDRMRAELRTAEVVRALDEKLLIERNLNRATTQLERSDAFHRLITELTSDFTFRASFRGEEMVLEYVSQGFVTITGYRLEQFSADRTWHELVFQDDLPIAMATLEKARLGEPDRSELRIVNREGTTCWLRYLTRPVLSPTGECIGIVGAAQQITAQKQLEELRSKLLTELAEKNAFIEAVLGQVPVGIVVAEAASGKLIRANQEASRLTGLTYREGDNLRELMHSSGIEFLQSDGTPYALDQWPMQRAINGEIVHDEKLTLQFRNGQRVLALSMNAGPIRDRQENVVAAVSVFHDESARREFEGQIQQSQRFLRCSLDSLSSHIAVLDEHGTILEVNQAWRRFAEQNGFNYPEYGVGANYLKPFESDTLECGDGETVARGIRDVIAGVTDSFEYEYPCHSHEEQRWFLLRVTRFNPPGPTRVVIAHENVTKLKLAVDALREADRRKDEFLATLAHELRNPLAPIRNAVQVLKHPDADQTSSRRTLDMIERQADQLSRLVDDLMDVSRVMRGKIELRLQSIALNEVINQALETSGPVLKEKQHQLHVRCSDGSICLLADPVRICQILGNLITNAAKYTEPNGQIELEASTEDAATAVIRIRDNGIGIAADKLQGIFDLFVQVDQTTTRAQGGLGIGLTLVKNLVELHGGSVSCSSAGLGLGSEFVVRLPLARQTTATPELPTALPGLPPISRSCRLLVVDDNRDAANSLAILLRMMGHEVNVAHSGDDALKSVATALPDAVFLDLGMPGMDGYEVARRLRTEPGCRELCLAALTGWGQADDRKRTAEAGFNHHIVKPPDLQTLLQVISGLRQNATASHPSTLSPTIRQ